VPRNTQPVGLRSIAEHRGQFLIHSVLRAPHPRLGVANEKGFYKMNYLDVSENRGTPKSSILIGVPIINHPF